MEIIVTVSNISEYEISIIRQLCRAKVRRFRINCAKFKSIDQLMSDINIIKNANPNNKIMLDIPYPGKKMRIRTEKILQVNKGEIRKLVQSTANSNDQLLCVSELVDGLQVGDRLWVDTGEGIFDVIEVNQNKDVYVIARNTFIIFDTKALVCKEIIKGDNDFLEIIKNVCPESVAFSFVESAESIQKEAQVIRDMGVEIVCKIESQKGIDNINNILNIADTIMIGRGDLALNSNIKYFIQNQIMLSLASKMAKKKCVIATGIADSMRNGGAPSRADLSDFAFIKYLQPDGIVLTRMLVMNNEIENILLQLNEFIN